MTWYTVRAFNLTTGEIREQQVSGKDRDHAMSKWLKRAIVRDWFVRSLNCEILITCRETNNG